MTDSFDILLPTTAFELGTHIKDTKSIGRRHMHTTLHASEDVLYTSHTRCAATHSCKQKPNHPPTHSEPRQMPQSPCYSISSQRGLPSSFPKGGRRRLFDQPRQPSPAIDMLLAYEWQSIDGRRTPTNKMPASFLERWQSILTL